MPPRLTPRTLLLAGAGLLVAALLLGLLSPLLLPALPGSALEAQAGLALHSAVAWLQQVALLVGSALVAVAFAVRALAPQDDPRPTAPDQPAGRDWN